MHTADHFQWRQVRQGTLIGCRRIDFRQCPHRDQPRFLMMVTQRIVRRTQHILLPAHTIEPLQKSEFIDASNRLLHRLRQRKKDQDRQAKEFHTETNAPDAMILSFTHKPRQTAIQIHDAKKPTNRSAVPPVFSSPNAPKQNASAPKHPRCALRKPRAASWETGQPEHSRANGPA